MLTEIVEGLALVIEIIGVFLISYTILKAFIDLIFRYKLNVKEASTDSFINSGLSNALEYLLAAEILKTLVVADKENLIILVVLIVIRVFIGLVLHYEGQGKS